MQRFILFLGHPLYALAVVLATLLGASGAGAAASPRLGARYGDSGAIGRAISALALVLLLYCLLLGPLFQALLGLSIGARIALAAALVAVPGFFMGQLLPAGVRIATRAAPGIVPWAWGLNGATSVLGSIAATALSMLLGFTATLLAGLAAYVAGAAVLVFTGTAAEQPAP
ncbi:MAG: hypothetical protein A2V77_20640 [Anaeromyxobacter sp. RBG_16_69_14]|nr:MAG: hypothetical protein A2V77_20640 [Anaeromyxobacter sp. RBG_16_69_14]